MVIFHGYVKQPDGSKESQLRNRADLVGQTLENRCTVRTDLFFILYLIQLISLVTSQAMSTRPLDMNKTPWNFMKQFQEAWGGHAGLQFASKLCLKP